MKRQNSIPQPLQNLPLNKESRRTSDDFLRPSYHKNHKAIETVVAMNDRDNSIVTDFKESRISVSRDNIKRVTLTEDAITLPTLENITCGFASAISNYRRWSANRNYDEEKQSTSTAAEVEASSGKDIEEGEGPSEEVASLFLIRDQGVVRKDYCRHLVGLEADEFLQSKGKKFKDKIRNLINSEKPEDNEHYIWIKAERDGEGELLVFSVAQIEHHLTHNRIKRVKWRHLSMDRISVYRYSVPIITTKFRLRVMHFLSQNYRCCILSVWCFVILFISIGIVLSVIFGSSPYMHANSRVTQILRPRYAVAPPRTTRAMAPALSH